VVVRQLLAGLQPEWEQAVVSAGKGRLAAWCEQHGFPYFSIPLFPLPRVLLGWPMLVLLLWRERPDVVFLHGQWAGPVGATACQLAGVARSVYIAHCPAFYHSNRIFRALRNYFAETIPLRCCDRVVVLSAGSWRNYIYRRWGPEEKLVKRKLPAMMDYRNHIREGSMLNTPPVFAVYVVLLTLRWVKAQGGIPEMEKRSIERSDLLYDTLDRLPPFDCPVAPGHRSRMNAVFTLPDARLEQAFLDACKEAGMIGVKGHRSVGGFRVSMYNALPLSSVQALTTLMEQFALQHG